MKIISVIFVTVLFVGSFIFLTGCGKRYTKNETETFILNAEGKSGFNLTNANGEMKIYKNDVTDEIKIIAHKTADVRKRDLDEPIDAIQIEIDSSGNEITVETNMKSDNFIFGFRGKKEVFYEIYVPENINLVFENQNGEVSINDITNDINLIVTNGQISLNNTTGKLNVESTNGRISCQATDTKGMNLQTVNGSIEVSVPDNIKLKFTAEVQNGNINHEQFELTNSESKKNFFSGQIGTDTPDFEIHAETINGSITFKKLAVAENEVSGKSRDMLEQAEKELEEAEKIFEEKKRHYDQLKKESKDTLKADI